MAWVKKQWNNKLSVFADQYECGNRNVHKQVKNLKRSSIVFMILIVSSPLFLIPLYYSSESTLLFYFNDDYADDILELPTEPFVIDVGENISNTELISISIDCLSYLVVDEYLMDILMGDRKECNSFVYINMMKINNKFIEYRNDTLNTFEWYLAIKEHPYRIIFNGYHSTADLHGKVIVNQYVIPCFAISFYTIDTKKNGTVFGVYSEIFNNKALFHVSYGSFQLSMTKLLYNYDESDFYANGIFTTKFDFPLLMALDMEGNMETKSVDVSFF